MVLAVARYQKSKKLYMDGKVGGNTDAQLIKDGLSTNKPEESKLNTNTELAGSQLTPNFHIDEFKCKDRKRSQVPKKYHKNVLHLAKNLQVIRDHFGVSISITSGYRTPAHNRAVGGASNSQHLYGTAADFAVPGKTPKQVRKAMLSLIKQGKLEEGGVGLYPSWMHYDVRGHAARW